MSELALWQEMALVGLAFLGLIYVYTFRIWAALATGADLLFAVALLSCVISVAFPQAFAVGARQVLSASSLPAALEGADNRLDAIEALPRTLVARALAKVGYELDAETTEADPTSDPNGLDSGSESGLDTPDAVRSPGRIEASIRPAVESLIALILRASTFASSLFLLMVALALRSSTATTRQLQALLERVNTLESQAATAAGPAGERLQR